MYRSTKNASKAGDERNRLEDKMKQLDASITSLQKKKNELTGATKKQQRRVTSLKESIARHVSKRKHTDGGLDDKINTILNNYKIFREVYHGGDFNGVNGRKIMKHATEIMAEIAELLKSSKREDSELSDEATEKHYTDCGFLLTRFDNYFRILRTGTNTDKARAEQARDLALSKLREMGLSVTPKAHLLERHAVEQMCAIVGGLQHLLEDWVEKFHQTAFVLEDNVKRVPELEKRAEAYGSLQEILGHSKVLKRASEAKGATERKTRETED